jgi:hypothetical protein
MYTYGGDTNFDGKLDADDYGTIDFSVITPAQESGYYNGDFNFDGKVDADDYGVIDFNILAQDEPFPTGAASASSAGLAGVTAVSGSGAAVGVAAAVSLAALVALAHDVIITVGVYALSGFEVTPATVTGILTILGFSLYDTVVIFDKIKENTDSQTLMARRTYEDVANFSLNHVLMRSLNTSLVVVLPILSLLLFGGETLKDFAFAMLIGVITGAYSSVFIAAQILVVLKEREPRYQTHRARIEGRGGERRLRTVDVPTTEAEALDDGGSAPAAVGAAAATRATTRTGPTNRPKSNKRKPPAKRKRR